MSRIRICAPSPADPKRSERIEKLKSLKPGKSCLRMTGTPLSQYHVRIATCHSTMLGDRLRGELQSKQIFRLDDPDALTRPVIRDRVPGQALPMRLDTQPQWKAVTEGREFDRVQNMALARQGAILLANEMALSDVEMPRIHKWPVIRVGDIMYKFQGGRVATDDEIDAYKYQSLYLRHQKKIL